MITVDARDGPGSGYGGHAPTPGRRTSDAVLVLRALGLGDALAGIPALRGIRRLWPRRFITLACGVEIGSWLQSLGVIDEVLPTRGLTGLAWPPPGWIGIGGHVAVDLHGKGPLSHRVLEATAPDSLVAFWCRRAGHLTGPRWRQDEHEVERWCRLIRSAGGRCDVDDLRLSPSTDRTTTVVLHPGAASPSRRWPADRWSRLAGGLLSTGHPVVITGGPEERRLCRDIADNAAAGRGAGADITVSAGALELTDLTAVIGSAAMVVCGDTGVAHLATALGTPSVLLFGPTPPQLWGPAIDPDLHTVIWHGDVNSPGDPHGGTIDPALDQVTVAEVVRACDHLWAGRYAGRA